MRFMQKRNKNMAKNKLIKNITVDELAVMMNNSFESQTKLIVDGFNNIDEKFNKVDENFKSVNENFKSVNENFKKVFNQLKTMDDKLDDVGSVKHRVDYIETILDLPAIKK